MSSLVWLIIKTGLQLCLAPEDEEPEESFNVIPAMLFTGRVV